MASHNLGWVPGAHVRFEDLDFIVTVKGGLAMAPVAARPLHSILADVMVD